MSTLRIVYALPLALSMAAAQPRIDRVINSGWTFTRQNAPGAASREYSEKGWDRVSLPHTWNALDGQDGGNDYYRGVGWYRNHIRIPSAYRGKSVFVKFDGASIVSHVFVNGRPAGEHRGAFAAFCFDVTPLVDFGGENVIAVEVSNARDTAVPPLRGDFTVFGGLYRSVHLVVLDRLAISPVDDASPGIFVTQKNVGIHGATVAVRAVVRNAGPEEKSGRLLCVITDGRGRRAAAVEASFSLPPGSRSFDLPDMLIAHPRLWQGRENPFLYRVEVSVMDGSHVTDRLAQPLGLRFFSVDPERGFILNGRAYPLRGVNRHQDREGMGWAIGAKEHREDFRLIVEMGCTAVRLAHYQHAQEFYDLCDSGGVVAWAELSLVDEVRPSAVFAESCRDQLRELIKQNFNHPSIIFWSLSNELIPDGNGQLYTGLIGNLNGFAKTLDPGRLTTLASRGNYDWSLGINTVTDVIGYNLYKGWYEKSPEDFGPAVDTLHNRLPGRPFCISEFGAGAGVHQHEFPATRPEPGGRWHPEEWQSLIHESTWRAIAARPWIWGAFVWCMFDFGSDGRSEGELPGRNDKGLVTYDRKVKKDAYYWYRANWNPSPLVYITGRRYTPRPSGPSEVRVYSNCDSVALSVNGVTEGTKECGTRVAVWSDVRLREGKNRIEAAGRGNSGSARDSCVVTCTGGPGSR